MRDPNAGPPQKRYALFKDGVRLEDDKLLAELIDPQILWTRVVCVFMEIGLVTKPAPHKPLSLLNEERITEEPDGDDCHLLVLYKKQQSFRNFHFNPAISVGTALKIITDSFNVPPTTINQEDWSLQRDSSTSSLTKIGSMEIADGDGNGSGGSTPTSSSHTSGGETPPVVTGTDHHNSNATQPVTISQSPPKNTHSSTDIASSAPISPFPLSPTKSASFPFSLFSSRGSSNVELSPVTSPLLALSAASPAGDPNYTQPASAPQSTSLSTGVKISAARSVPITTKGEMHECIFTSTFCLFFLHSTLSHSFLPPSIPPVVYLHHEKICSTTFTSTNGWIMTALWRRTDFTPNTPTSLDARRLLVLYRI